MPDSPVKFGNNLGHDASVPAIKDYFDEHRYRDDVSSTIIRAMDRSGLTIADVGISSTCYSELGKATIQIEVQQGTALVIQDAGNMDVAKQEGNYPWSVQHYQNLDAVLYSLQLPPDSLAREWFTGFAANDGIKSTSAFTGGGPPFFLPADSASYLMLTNSIDRPQKIEVVVSGSGFSLKRLKFMAFLRQKGNREIAFSSNVYMPN